MEDEKKMYIYKEMGKKRNTLRYVRANGKDVLDIEGTMKLMTPAHRSSANYKDNGVFEIFAKFDTKVGFNEHEARRYLAKRMKELFNPSKYLLITECQPHVRRRQKDLGRYLNLEYYAKCDRPEPEKVQQLKTIVGDMMRECGE